MVEALVTASPAFFKGKKKTEIQAFFQEAKVFMEQNLSPGTIISAVVHMDEKTPHMHLCFVPLTTDHRLSAKDILGNKKKLSQWQDRFWEHMARKFPELERGESAFDTGRTHIPPRVFKQMTRLNRQKAKLDDLLTGINPLNAKKRTEEIGRILDKYIPAVTQMDTTLKKYRVAFTETTAQNKELREETAELARPLDNAKAKSVMKTLQDGQLRRDYAEATAILERIPKEVIDAHGRRRRSLPWGCAPKWPWLPHNPGAAGRPAASS